MSRENDAHAGVIMMAFVVGAITGAVTALLVLQLAGTPGAPWFAPDAGYAVAGSLAAGAAVHLVTTRTDDDTRPARVRVLGIAAGTVVEKPILLQFLSRAGLVTGDQMPVRGGVRRVGTAGSHQVDRLAGFGGGRPRPCYSFFTVHH